MKADKEVALRWTGGLQFEGGPADGPGIVVDGDSQRGPSPMDLALTAVAACMAIDVKLILEKMRAPLETLDVTAQGERVDDAPRRFSGVRLAFRVGGLDEADLGKAERAVELSQQKHCSVLFTMRPDLQLETVVELAARQAPDPPRTGGTGEDAAALVAGGGANG